MRNKILDRYSKLQSPDVTHQTPQSPPIPSSPIPSHDLETPQVERHIRRPVYSVLKLAPYAMSWVFGLLTLLLGLFITKFNGIKLNTFSLSMNKIMANPISFFTLWVILFCILWTTHCIGLLIERRQSMSPKIYARTSYISQVEFVGLREFSEIAVFLAILYLVWQ